MQNTIHNLLKNNPDKKIIIIGGGCPHIDIHDTFEMIERLKNNNNDVVCFLDIFNKRELSEEEVIAKRLNNMKQREIVFEFEPQKSLPPLSETLTLRQHAEFKSKKFYDIFYKKKRK